MATAKLTIVSIFCILQKSQACVFGRERINQAEMKFIRNILCGIGVFLLLSTNFLLSQTPTKETDGSKILKPADNIALSPFILLDEDNSSHILLVEKRSQRLFVLNKQNGSLSIESSYLCSTGKVSGNKQESGDMKTPEGIYFLRKTIDPSTLPPKYGAGAYVLDYPNGFDFIKKRKGYGIWIHGTNEPERLKKSMDTRGCVILKNEDFIDLAKYIQLHKTPIIIVDEIQYRKMEFVNKDRKETMEFLEGWKASWESKKVEDYIKLYSKDFRHEKMNIREYRSYKKRIFSKYTWIKLDLSNIQILRHPQYILINFLQKYSANTYSDFGVKQLFIIKENNTYRIIKENWIRIQN